jgi:hypothetical protein
MSATSNPTTCNSSSSPATTASSSTSTSRTPRVATSQLSRTDYFDIMRPAFESRGDESSEVLSGTMRLGAAYNVFDGEELLEASVRSVRAGGVDFVCVVFQTVSNFGAPCSEKLVPLLHRLRDEGLVDELIEYAGGGDGAIGDVAVGGETLGDQNSTAAGRATDGSLTGSSSSSHHGRPGLLPLQPLDVVTKESLVSTRAGACVGGDVRAVADQFFFEVSKRELGRQHCARAGCSHFMSLDCDEFYLPDQLQWAKSLMASSRYEGLAAKMKHYYKSPKWQLEPHDNLNHVMVMCVWGGCGGMCVCGYARMGECGGGKAGDSTGAGVGCDDSGDEAKARRGVFAADYRLHSVEYACWSLPS